MDVGKPHKKPGKSHRQMSVMPTTRIDGDVVMPNMSRMPTPPAAHPLAHVFAAAKGVTRLARELGLSHSTLLGWVRVPDKYVVRVSQITRIPRSTLRPDIFPPAKPRERRPKR